MSPVGLPLSPFPITYRELWLPPAINENAFLPASAEGGGHTLVFTGARRGTTCDGVHGIAGVATSNINLGAIHNNENILYIKIRFKLDQPFAAGAAADQYLFGKFDDATNYLIGWLESTDGKFYMEHNEAGAAETISSTETTWDTGWHTVLVSLHNVNGQRLIVDGGTPVVEAGNITPITLTADFCLLARDDGVSTQGLLGVEVDVVMGIAALTAGEENDLYLGFPPAAATEEYLLDEGRGVTAYNRGSAGAASDGTLDTSCTWKFGQVQQPVISSDGINDRVESIAGANIAGDITIIWVGKVKSTYDGLSGVDRRFFNFEVAGSDLITYQYLRVADAFRLLAIGGGTVRTFNYAVKPSIDDYQIIIATLTLNGVGTLYIDGNFIDSFIGLPAIAAGPAIAYINNYAATEYNISKALFLGLIDGAFTRKQVLAYSRYLKNIFNLPISI